MKFPVLKKIWKHEHECNIQGNQGFWKGPWNHTFKYAGGIDYFCSVLTVIAFTDKRRDKLFEGGQTRQIHSLCSLKISSGLYWLSFPDLYVMFITIGYHHHLMSYIFLMNIVILLTMIKGQSHAVKAENITDLIHLHRKIFMLWQKRLRMQAVWWLNWELPKQANKNILQIILPPDRFKIMILQFLMLLYMYKQFNLIKVLI